MTDITPKQVIEQNQDVIDKNVVHTDPFASGDTDLSSGQILSQVPGSFGITQRMGNTPVINPEGSVPEDVMTPGMSFGVAFADAVNKGAADTAWLFGKIGQQDVAFNTMGQHPNPVLNEDQIKELHKNYPGIELPEGVKQATASILTDAYINRRYLKPLVMRESPTILGRLSAFAGGMAGGLTSGASAVFLPLGGAFAGLSRMIVPRAMTSLGASEIMGQASIQTSQKILQNSMTAGLFGGAIQGEDETIRNMQLNEDGQPLDVMQSAINVAQSFGTNALIFAGIGAGHVLGKKAFNRIPTSAKQATTEAHQPWTETSNYNANQDAFGQTLNNTAPEVSPILKQGEADAAARYKHELASRGIDIQQTLEQFHEANKEIQTRINRVNEQDAVPENVNQRWEAAKAEIEKTGRITQADLDKVTNAVTEHFDADPLENFEHNYIKPEFDPVINNVMTQPDIYWMLRRTGQADSFIPKNVQERFDFETRINRFQGSIDRLRNELETAEPKRHKEIRERIGRMQKNVKALREKMPEIESVTEEARRLQAELMPEGETVRSYRETDAFKRLKDLARINPEAHNRYMRVILGSDKAKEDTFHELRYSMMEGLVNQRMMAESAVRHLSGKARDISALEQENYATHIQNQESEIEPIIEANEPPDTLPPYRELLDQYSKSQIEALKRTATSPELSAALDRAIKKMGQKEMFTQMANDLIDCIIEDL